MESEQDSLKGLKQTWLNPSDGFAATSPFRGGKDLMGSVSKINHNLHIALNYNILKLSVKTKKATPSLKNGGVVMCIHSYLYRFGLSVLSSR